MISGIVYSDSLVAGGMKVNNQAIEVATTMYGEFYQEDGIFGLAFDSLNTSKQTLESHVMVSFLVFTFFSALLWRSMLKGTNLSSLELIQVSSTVAPNKQLTFMTNLINANQLEKPIVSVDLRYHATGCYTFGALPSWASQSSITYTPIDSSLGYWMFSPTGFAVGNGTVNATKPRLEGLVGAADTGTSLMLLDDTVVRSYWSHVKSAKISVPLGSVWVFDCSEAASLPNFRLQFSGKGPAGGGTEVVIPGQYLNYVANGDGSKFSRFLPFVFSL